MLSQPELKLIDLSVVVFCHRKEMNQRSRWMSSSGGNLLGLVVNDLPVGIIAQHSGHECGMNSVPAAFCLNPRQQGQPEKGKIADDVDYLVSHKLIGEPQPILVHQTALRCQDDCVIESAAPDKTEVPQRLDLRFRNERSRRCDLPRKLAV